MHKGHIFDSGRGVALAFDLLNMVVGNFNGAVRCVLGITETVDNSLTGFDVGIVASHAVAHELALSFQRLLALDADPAIVIGIFYHSFNTICIFDIIC